jgi:hypothetical protein
MFLSSVAENTIPNLKMTKAKAKEAPNISAPRVDDVSANEEALI